MMAAIGRPREFDRDAALAAATRVFWRKGYSATSMNDLCDAMCIRSPSLYAAFGGKEALCLEAIDYYAKAFGPPVWSTLLEQPTARASVESLLRAAADIFPESPDGSAGCMVMFGAVGDEWPEAPAEAIGELRRICLDNLRSRLTSAVADGELPPETDVERLSRFYLSVIQGMSIQAADAAASKDLKGIAETAMLVWPTVLDKHAERSKRVGD